MCHQLSSESSCDGHFNFPSFTCGSTKGHFFEPDSKWSSDNAKIADQSITANKIVGVGRFIFANCSMNFGSVNPRADALADCSVQGILAGDNVVATPNDGMWDAVTSLDGKVRILVHNNSDNILQGTPTTWSVIVFHK